MILITRSITIGLVVGEHSGDFLAAGLMRALRRHVSNIHFVGVSGPRMELEGIESWYNIKELSMIGIVELFMRIPRILYIRNDLIRRFSVLKPDVFVGIDSPDFTIFLEKRLKKCGIRVIHYVSPSIWAWRKNRIFKLGLATDNILSFLPFEKLFYDKFNIPCQFIGHSLADIFPLDPPDKMIIRRELGITTDGYCIAVLPGSRKHEVDMLAKDFLCCVKLLSKKFPNIEVIVPLFNNLSINKFQNNYLQNIKLHIVNNNFSYKAMVAADVALLASGTATLECMLAKCPMVVAYRLKFLTFIAAKILVKTPWISLPNLLAGRELVKEFIQNHCYPKNLEKSISYLLNNERKSSELRKIFRELHQQIRCNADEQAAHAVLKLINI